MKATIINCTLKPSPEASNSEALSRVIIDELESEGVACELIRAVDFDLKPGVASDMGDGDEWPAIREKVVSSEIIIIATPTWLGRPSSVSQRVLERMDALMSETDEQDRPLAYNHVAGVVVTGNEDGAHHVISEIVGALLDIGYTVPGQAWTYWTRAPGPARHTSSRTKARIGQRRPVRRRQRISLPWPGRSRTSRCPPRSAPESDQALRSATGTTPVSFKSR